MIDLSREIGSSNVTHRGALVALSENRAHKLSLVMLHWNNTHLKGTPTPRTCSLHKTYMFNPPFPTSLCEWSAQLLQQQCVYVHGLNNYYNWNVFIFISLTYTMRHVWTPYTPATSTFTKEVAVLHPPALSLAPWRSISNQFKLRSTAIPCHRSNSRRFWDADCETFSRLWSRTSDRCSNMERKWPCTQLEKNAADCRQYKHWLRPCHSCCVVQILNLCKHWLRPCHSCCVVQILNLCKHWLRPCHSCCVVQILNLCKHWLRPCHSCCVVQILNLCKHWLRPCHSCCVVQILNLCKHWLRPCHSCCVVQILNLCKHWLRPCHSCCVVQILNLCKHWLRPCHSCCVVQILNLCKHWLRPCHSCCVVQILNLSKRIHCAWEVFLTSDISILSVIFLYFQWYFYSNQCFFL